MQAGAGVIQVCAEFFSAHAQRTFVEATTRLRVVSVILWNGIHIVDAFQSINFDFLGLT
jgi:hypothetical protein